MLFDLLGNVYLAGYFTSFGGAPNTMHVAKWNGTTWEGLGTGADALVRTIAVDPSGNLYAGGDFTSMGGVANTAKIAKWNRSSSAWEALGTGATGNVYSLASDTLGNIYAGGDFSSMGGVANTRRIARWNSTLLVWQSLGVNGASARVGSIAVDAANDNVYIVGSLTTVGGVTANKNARRNGTTWGVIEGALWDVDKSAVTFSSTGNVWVGGDNGLFESRNSLGNSQSFVATSDTTDGRVFVLRQNDAKQAHLRSISAGNVWGTEGVVASGLSGQAMGLAYNAASGQGTALWNVNNVLWRRDFSGAKA